MNIECAICRTKFQSADDVYGTTCGHLCHKDCMVSSNRFQVCSQCKQEVKITLQKVYLSGTNNFEQQVQDLQERLEIERVERAAEMDKFTRILREHCADSLSENNTLQRRIQNLEKENQANKQTWRRQYVDLVRENKNLQGCIKKLEEEKQANRRELKDELATCMNAKLSFQNRVAELEKTIRTVGNSVDPKTDKHNQTKSKTVKVVKNTEENARGPRPALGSIDPNKENALPTNHQQYNLRPR